MGEPSQPKPPFPAPAEERLDSWKEIATYLKREVRTVRRWEKNEGLPVHRHVHNRLASVYAFPAELDAWLERRQPGASEEADRGRWTRSVWIWVAAGVLLAAAAGLVWHFTSDPAASPPSENRVLLVVLPFENLGGDPEQEYFSDGMTDEMISRLGKLDPERLGVIGLASAMQYKGLAKGIQEIGKELDVDYVLEGGVRRGHGQLRMTARLVRVADQAQVWAESFEKPAGDVLEVQREVALSIAHSIEVKLALEQESDHRPAPMDQQAYEDYLRGRFFLNKFSGEGFHRSIVYFQRALARQPNHAPSLTWLAAAHALLGNTNVPPREAYGKAKESVAKALQIEPSLAEAHAQMGFCAMLYDFDWALAEREFRTALELDPNSVLAHHGYAVFLVTQGRFAQGLAEIERARQLDPLSLIVNADIGWLLFHARRYPDAEAQLKKTLDLQPDFAPAHIFLGHVYGQMGREEEAKREMLWLMRTIGADERAAVVLRVLEEEGLQAARRVNLRSLQRESEKSYVPAYWFATIHLSLGETEKAMALLEKAAVERHWMIAFLKVDPRMDPLRSEPRFQDLLRKMKLADGR